MPAVHAFWFDEMLSAPAVRAKAMRSVLASRPRPAVREGGGEVGRAGSAECKAAFALLSAVACGVDIVKRGARCERPLSGNHLAGGREADRESPLRYVVV